MWLKKGVETFKSVLTVDAWESKYISASMSFLLLNSTDNTYTATQCHREYH